jgi:hypothetical protein
MIRHLPYLFLSILHLSIDSFAQEVPSTMSHTFYLVGDAGLPNLSNSIFEKVLRQQIQASGPNATVIFLGDNIYPKGLPQKGHPRRAISENILQGQVDLIKDLDAHAIFIPGNHDWAHWGNKGFEYIQNQQQWIDSLKRLTINFLPRDGCPGPVEIPLNDNAVLVILDTQWLLHGWDKPGEDSPCEAKTTAELLALLADIVNRNQHKRIIVAGHHPLITYGEHGGVFTLKNHLFPLTDISPSLYIPLPIAGSIYPLYRKWFGHIQDTQHPVYKEFSNAIQKILANNPGSIYISGHEHALEYILKDSTHFIVSGSGSKISYVRKKDYAQLAEGVRGFVKLSIGENGSADIQYYEVDEAAPEGKLLLFKQIAAPPPAKNEVEKIVDFPRFVRVKASSQYEANAWHKKMLGENYRKEWAAEIDVPVFDISKEHGGLKILQKGGGQQTLSLRLEDSTGHEYVLRSVEKFPENAVPEMLRNTFAQDLVQDQISASHPYAALVVPALAEAAGIYHTNPKVVYIPDDPRLKEYRKAFAGTLALFEERPAGNWHEQSFFGNSKKIVNTSKIIEKLITDNDNHVDQEFVLRSRLFDLIIGDWDRHDDQWRWATLDGKKGDVFRPIPRDRDQAFFVNEGKIAKVWSRKWALPKFEGFDDAINWPSGLSFNARYFDRTFLTELSKEDWIRIARKLQDDLTDEKIEKAIHLWPDTIARLHGESITRSLKMRRDNLVEDAVSHYEFLAKQVDVVGSDKQELFEVERLPNGDAQVKVYKITREGSTGKKLYDRLFKASETKELRLYGLQGSDEFKIKGEGSNSILVRAIGGEGHDVISDSTKARGKGVIFYDLNGENQIITPAQIKNKTSSDPEVNNYNRKAFQYDRLAPLLYGNFNPDDGVFVGAGFLSIIHGFRKQPYKQQHIFLASIAPRTLSFNFKYSGKFREVIGQWNLETDIDVKSPNYVNNFFGMGNESVFDKNIENNPSVVVDRSIQYYRYRFKEIKIDAFLSRKIGGVILFKAGPSFQRVELEKPKANKDRFIESYAVANNLNLFEKSLDFGGASWQVMVDKRNDPRFTKRGIVWNVTGRNMAGLNAYKNNFSAYESSLSLYHSFKSQARLVFALRAGTGINTGKYQFYQAQILDGKTELRGFRKTRFYGDQKFYSNFEIRLKLLQFHSYLFPATLGLLGFHDLGRVWYKDANGIDPSASDGKSNVWHHTWGGGVWFTPFNVTVVSAEVGHSTEGTLFYMRLGFLF